jgi:hypothetical protein
MNKPKQRPVSDRIRLMARIWFVYLQVVFMSRRPLPDQIKALNARPVRSGEAVAPERLGSAIHRGLRLGRLAPRCLPKALVMFEILRSQGENPELVIGLPLQPSSHEAHAWVEMASVDVGPPPGRAGHEELARYP